MNGDEGGNVKVYGSSVVHCVDDRARHVEEVRLRGVTIVPGRLSGLEVEEARARLEAVYADQVREVGEDVLATTGESDTARCVLAYDPYFLRFAADEEILGIVHALMGEWTVLLLQNGVLNRSGVSHQQAAWHRDLAHQSYVSSRALAVSAFWCLNEFTEETGGTVVLPYSQREEALPSVEFVERNALQIEAEAGSVLVFDSMMFHRAGRNRSGSVRMGVNHVYGVPILQQQVVLPAILGDRYRCDERYRRLLGYESEPATSVVEYRRRRLARLGESGPTA